MIAHGNKCGHNAANPQLDLKFPAANRPSVITSVIHQIKKFYYDPSRIMTLARAANSKRQTRSERREALVLVLCCIAKYVNVKKGMNVGWQKADGTFQHLTLQNICNQTGLSMSRVQRAVAVIKRVGMLTVIEQSKQSDDGAYVGLPAIKFVSIAFFGMFGLADKLMQYKTHIEAQKKKAEQTAREKAATAASIKAFEEQAAKYKAQEQAASGGLTGSLAKRFARMQALSKDRQKE